MFKKTETTYTIDTMAKAIDDAIAKAQAEFVDGHRIVDLLESCVAGLRARQAVNFSSAPIFHSGNL
jgi:hypothetical protein